MSRSLTRFQAAILGLVVLCGTALGGWAVFRIGTRQGFFAETYELRAGVHQAHGLARGTPVRVRGIDAGQVVGLELPAADDPSGKVYARLRIDRKFQPLVPADSKAHVLSEGVLGGRLINIEPGKQRGSALNDGDEIEVIEARELADIMHEATQTLREIRDSNGTLAKLVKTDEAHQEMMQLVKDTRAMIKKGEETFATGQEVLREGKETLSTLKQDAEAIKRLPIIRGYVEDTLALLYRPDQNSDRRIYASDDLFEPGSAVLTEAGKAHLSNLAPWLESTKVKGSEVVVVSYANPASPDLPGPAAQALTQKRSEAVAAFLRDHLKAHKLSWMSSRDIHLIGMGQNPPPVPEKEPLAPDRTEVVVFTPR